MLFKVKVVSRDEYDDYLDGLVAKGDESEKPLLGGDEAYTQAGLEGEDSE